MAILALGLLFASTPGFAALQADSHAPAVSDSGEQKAVTAQPGKEQKEAGEEDENAAFKHSASVQLLARWTGMSLDHAYWLSMLLNFAIVAGIIIWASRKYLPGFFNARTASIQKAMEEARKASQEANQRLAEIEARLSRLDVEIGAMRATADKEAAAEEARIKAAAEEDARKIVESAEQEIAAAAKAARRELTAYAAGLAVSLAEKQMRVDAATDQALVRSFTEELAATERNSGKNGH